jgi:acetyltransferase-like isoleucine patch superfamily enzyme
MTRLLKKLLSLVLAPVIRALWPAAELLQRLRAFVLLSARISTPVDPSVVILSAPEVIGTGRIRLGRNLRLYSDLYLETQDEGSIEIGDDVVISRGTHLVAHRGIAIGNGTMIGEYCSIRDGNHRRDDATGSIRETGHDSAPITIGSHVWIGRGVMVLPGVTIGDGATVGANAVVTRHVPPGVLVAGVPAKIIPRKVPLESGSRA